MDGSICAIARGPDGGRGIGDRSETTAPKVWQALPENKRACPADTDEYDVYPRIVPPEQHRPAPKDAHQTNHQGGNVPRIIRRVSLRVSKTLKASINEG